LNNKILSIKITSSIFLAIVLVAGTIALSYPSFMIGAAQASSDREKDHDNDDKKKSHGKDRDRDDKSRDHDKYDDKKSYEKDSYESQYSSYEKDNNSYKSKDGSSSVSIKKVKCNNINVNLNGLDVNVGIPNGNGPVTGPIAVAQEAEDNEDETITASSFEDGERKNNGYKQNDKDFKFVCINNNNNTVIEEEPISSVPPTPPEPLTCEECFEEFLSPDEIDLFGELFGSAIDRFCILFTNPEFEIVVPEDAFRMALPDVDSEDIDNLIDCLEEEGVIFIQDLPPI